MADIDVQICSKAATLLGAGQIISLDASDDVSKACKAIYTQEKENALAIHPWRFSIKKAQLAKDSVTPISRWKFRYKLPPDRIINVAIKVYDTGAEDSVVFLDYELQDNAIFTHVEEIFVDYQQNVPEAEWPVYFNEYVTLQMAAQLALVITENQKRAELFIGKAETQFKRARNKDGQGNPSRRIQYSSLRNSRFGGVPR